MNDNPVDQKQVNSARKLAELEKRQAERLKKEKALLKREQEITKRRAELLKSEEIVEVAEKALNDHYSKVKSQQYRWEKRLNRDKRID